MWGPYQTNICEHCESLIEQGRQWEVPETVAASITVRDNWLAGIDPEEWREREHGLIAYWLTIRTDRMEVPLGKPRCKSEFRLDGVSVVDCGQVCGHDGPHHAEIMTDDDSIQHFEWA